MLGFVGDGDHNFRVRDNSGTDNVPEKRRVCEGTTWCKQKLFNRWFV
jgi:hypothetical protein